MTGPALRRCDRCRTYGLVRLNYHSGEPFDVAICACPAGQYWRYQGEVEVRARLKLTDAQQVTLIEHVEADAVTPPTDDFIEAGKTAKRAKL